MHLLKSLLTSKKASLVVTCALLLIRSSFFNMIFFTSNCIVLSVKIFNFDYEFCNQKAALASYKESLSLMKMVDNLEKEVFVLKPLDLRQEGCFFCKKKSLNICSLLLLFFSDFLFIFVKLTSLIIFLGEARSAGLLKFLN